MPCYDPYAKDDYADEKYKGVREALNERTAQLCEICRTLEERGAMFLLSARNQRWWKTHKEHDAKHNARPLK